MTAIPSRLAAALADRYRIERELGQGGMATVYLAEDLKHRRRVALKVLKPELAAVLGAERFVIEITTTAALQHPHILPLFDSGTADGFLYYVMPFIDGETLRDKLNRETQLGVNEAVKIASDVADALHYAHSQGVVHRDIKPENMLLANGRPMVADFGIALALSAAAGGRMTETGLSLGTPHYMSPEQATAEKEITARSDIYSLGSVLYEMLAGQPPHLGGSAQQIVMKIIAEPVAPVTKHRKSVPPNVAAAVEKALEKLPADRFETAKAFADALSNPAFTSLTHAGIAAGGTRGVPRGVLAGVATVIAMLLVTTVWGWLRPGPESPVVRLDLSVGAVKPNLDGDLAISPDGSMLALAGTGGTERAIFIRDLSGAAEFRKVPGTESGMAPAFSPDSRWIVFRRDSDNSLAKVAVSGGGLMTLVPPGPIQPFGPDWYRDDEIIFRSPQGTYRVSASGGTPRALPKAAPRTLFMLPDGSGMLTTTGGGVAVYDFDSDSTTMLVPSAAHPWYVKTGHLLYVAEGDALFAVTFDLRRHRITGSPVRVLDRVGYRSNARGYSVSRNGTLVFRDAQGSGGSTSMSATRLLVIGFDGSVDTLRLPRGRRARPRFSPDGRIIAFEHQTSRGGETDIHTFDLVTGTNTRITFDGDNDDPVWSPDGRRIVFSKGTKGNGEDLFVKPADNSGPEQSVLTLPGNQNATGWLADETILFTSMIEVERSTDLLTFSLSGGAKPKPYLQAPWPESHLNISPDGKLAAFSAAESGAMEVWIRDFPKPRGKWLVSAGDGEHPRWSHDGRYVYFWRQGAPLDTLFRARVESAPEVAVRAPEVMATVDISGVANWDLHPDGRRFIAAVDDIATTRAAGSSAESRYIVVLNWFAELAALTRSKTR